jgi:predicted ABC-type ATPase
MKPIYWIIAGVYGAGKSTFYNVEVEKNPVLVTTKRITPDEILKSFGGVSIAV